MSNNWNNSLSTNSEPVNINGYVSENENNMINTPGGIKLRKIRIPTARKNKNRKAAASGPSILRVLKPTSEHKKTPKPANPVSRPPRVPTAVSAEPPVPSSPMPAFVPSEETVNYASSSNGNSSPLMPAFVPSEETVNYASSFNGNSSPPIESLFKQAKKGGKKSTRRSKRSKRNKTNSNRR